MSLLGSPAGLATQSICCFRLECPNPAHPRWAWYAVGEKWRRGMALEPKAKHVGAPATIRNAMAMIMAARCRVKELTFLWQNESDFGDFYSVNLYN